VIRWPCTAEKTDRSPGPSKEKRAFRLFRFAELGTPIMHEKSPHAVAA
jgi:hypothetical protein